MPRITKYFITPTIAAEWLYDPHGASLGDDGFGLALLEIDAVGKDRKIDRTLAFNTDQFTTDAAEAFYTPWRANDSYLDPVIVELEISSTDSMVRVESSADGVTVIDSALAGWPYPGPTLTFRLRVASAYWRVAIVAGRDCKGTIRSQQRPTEV